MTASRLRKLARRFAANAMKVLLENPENVRDVFSLLRAKATPWIDFAHMRATGTTFVQRDYRHVEADIVLEAPLRDPNKPRSRRRVIVYVLIEHQSEPDALMPLRVLEYVVEIYRRQLRQWVKDHPSDAGFRLQPVIPIVFYTGTRTWERVGKVIDLVDLGEMFEELTPALEPLFFNLQKTSSEKLESEGGFFGQVLRLLQSRGASGEEFQEVLREALTRLEGMPAQQQQRWLELLSYLQALVYHVRGENEQEPLLDLIEAAAKTDELRQELTAMGRTGADALIEKGYLKGRRASLLDLLRERFGEIPSEVVATIEATTKLDQLKEWLRRTLTAETLDDVKIRQRSRRP